MASNCESSRLYTLWKNYAASENAEDKAKFVAELEEQHIVISIDLPILLAGPYGLETDPDAIACAKWVDERRRAVFDGYGPDEDMFDNYFDDEYLRHCEEHNEYLMKLYGFDKSNDSAQEKERELEEGEILEEGLLEEPDYSGLYITPLPRTYTCGDDDRNVAENLVDQDQDQDQDLDIIDPEPEQGQDGEYDYEYEYDYNNDIEYKNYKKYVGYHTEI